MITINIKEAQHPLKWENQVIDKSSIMLKISTKSMHRVLVWEIGPANNTTRCSRLKQPDLYYFEAIKMTSQAWSNFVWRILACGSYSLWTLTRLVMSFLWFQNSINQVVSLNKCFITYRATAKNIICRNTAKVVKRKVRMLQLLNV